MVSHVSLLTLKTSHSVFCSLVSSYTTPLFKIHTKPTNVPHKTNRHQAKAIQRLIVQLCSEVRGIALALVSAFNLPDHILRAPIGLAANSGVDFYREYLNAVGFDV